jgi:hypothetical protein
MRQAKVRVAGMLIKEENCEIKNHIKGRKLQDKEAY